MSVSNQQFSCGCATANRLLHFKEPGQSERLVHFPMLNTSLAGETLHGKKQLPFFSSFAVVVLKWKVDEDGAHGHQEKDCKTHSTDF